MYIPEEVIEEIVSSIDIVSYIESRGIKLKKRSSFYEAVCPLPGHVDHDPSFKVVPSGQYYNCFGCGRSGDVISFIMEVDGLSFPEAVRVAADYAGVVLPEEALGHEETQEFAERQLLNAVYLNAAEYCNKIMPQDIRKHLRSNYGFTDEFINEKKIGFCDEHLFKYLHVELGFNKEDLFKSGLFVKTRNGDAKSFFNTRIVFWYWKRGFPVYAIGRETEYTKNLKDYDNFERHSKYKKLLTYDEETRPYVSKQVQNKYIYNEDICLAPKNRPGYVIITEGITDAMIAEMLGIPVISPVTVRYRHEDLKKLKQLIKHIPVIYIVNDNEANASGLKGALDTAKFLNEQGKGCYITILPRPEDLDKIDLNVFLQGKNKPQFEKFLTENSKLYHDFIIEEALKYRSDGNEAMYYERLNDALFEAKMMEPILREGFFKKLAKDLGLSKKTIEAQYKEVINGKRETPEYKESDDYYSDLLEQAKGGIDSEAQKLFKCLLDRGAKFYRLSDTEVTMILDGRFYDINHGESPFTVFLMNEFGMNYMKQKIKEMIFEFKAKALKHATKLKKQTWLFCDKIDKKVYFGIGHDTPFILRITPSEISKIYNGEDDGIFVNQPDDIMEYWDFDPGIDKLAVARDLYEVFTEYVPVKKEDGIMFLTAALSLPLKRFVDTIPIVKVHGRASAGKTQLAKKIANLYYGNELAIGDMTDASKFDQASVRPIIVFDNLENIKQGALEQFLLYSASGGTREMRNRGENSGTIKQIIDTFTILTAIHPFDKPELLNRSLDFFASSTYHSSKRDVTSVNDEIRERRPEFLSLWVMILQEVLRNISKRREKRDLINRLYPKSFKERLNGYFGLMWQFADVFLKYVGWTQKEIDDMVISWIGRQIEMGKDNEKETSEIFSFFTTLADYIRNGMIGENGLNIVLNSFTHHADEKEDTVIIEATSGELLNAFKILARATNRTFSHDNNQQLMARVNNDLEVLKENGWTIETSRKKVAGSNIHYFSHTVEADEVDLPPTWKV